MVEIVVVNRKISLRVYTSKHFAVAIEIIWRVAIKKIVWIFFYNILESIAVNG